MQEKMRSRFGKPHVCVVGAGASGLRCAEILLENGWQVTILEARNRIGGRVCSNLILSIRMLTRYRYVKVTNLDIQRTCMYLHTSRQLA